MDRVERKLSAILAADVADYSRLMGIDEEGTLLRLTVHRHDVFDPSIVRNRGRIVKTTGDGLLAVGSVAVPMPHATPSVFILARSKRIPDSATALTVPVTVTWSPA